jgi:hypothetical protein
MDVIMKDSSFHIRWGSFILGLLLGFVSILFALFAKTEKRDKFYSCLLGSAVSMAINLFFIKYAINSGLFR